MGGARGYSKKLFLLPLLIYLLAPATFSASLPLAALKGGIDGQLYIPNPAYVPNLHVIKIELWCNMSDTDCQSGICGCSRSVGDQTGGVRPYSTISHWPDGTVDGQDTTAAARSFGAGEGMSLWDYMADIDPDRVVDGEDTTQIARNFGQGIFTYSTDLTNIKVVFDTGDTVYPDSYGYINIPAGATAGLHSFTVYNGSKTVVALATFWNVSVQPSQPSALVAMKGGTNGYLYIPSPTYEPNVTSIKIEEWCNMSSTDCQTLTFPTAPPNPPLVITKCGCDRLLCDLAGGVNPYYPPGGGPLFWRTASWPNGQIDAADSWTSIYPPTTLEGYNVFPFTPWEYEADCVPDRNIQMSDLIPTWFTGFTGTYSTDISNINVVFDTPAGAPPVSVSSLGYVTIPAGATSFTVYNGPNTVMALATFWNTSVKSSQMTQSASPPSFQLPGYPVTFTCNYINSSNNKIPGAIVNVYINGTAYLTTETATGYQLNHTFTTIGNYSWYCSGTDPTGEYTPAVAPPENYEIKPLYCNISWAAAPSAPGDFKTNPDQHFAQAVNYQVTVAVNLTDKNGAPVQNVRATVTPPATPPPGMGAAQLTTLSDVNGIAWVTFTEPATIGKYTVLSASSTLCLGGYDVQPADITSYINAYHDVAKSINVIDPNPKTIYVNPGDFYNITIEILDQFGNVCNSSFDGTPYNYTTIPPEYNSTVGINQTVKNSTDTWYYDIPLCSMRSPLECYTIFNKSTNPQGIPVGLEGIYTFQLFAHIPEPNTIINNITNDIEQFDLTYPSAANTSLNDSTFDSSARTLTGDSVIVVYNQPHPPPDRLRVIAQPHQISVNDSFNITVQAILQNDSVDKNNNNITRVIRLHRLDAPQVQDQDINNSCQLVNGVCTFNVTSNRSLNLFNVSGVYRIFAIQTSDSKVNGTGTLIVGTGAIDHINVTVNHNGVFTSLPFYATASVRDAGDNIITNFTGDMNITCPPFTTDPPQQSVSLTPADEGQTTFTEIANQSGTIWCNVSAFDSIKRVLITGNFSVLVVEPDMCSTYSIPPVIAMPPPIDVTPPKDKIPPASTITPQIHAVMQTNYEVGPHLIGYNPATGQMEGNYSICLESYYSGRFCINGSDIQFDRDPISVCVKEFVYNPEADGYISDHINYNGVDDFKATFKHPEIVWGWGYKGASGTYTNCSTNGVDKYEVTLTPPPQSQVHTDFFNVTVTLPLGALESYNITNTTALNPHELQAPAAILVADQWKYGPNPGRIAKFDMPVPGDEAAFLEDYNYSITGANAQAMAYDNRGNIYVALTDSAKILVMRMVRSYPPSLHFVKIIDVKTFNGTAFFPYGMDTDSWGNLYVVGNTNPDQPDNVMCINKYNKTYGLNDSNECCGPLNGDGECSEKWEGTVPSITVNEAGSEVYIVKDKKRVCTNLGITCFWTGNPLYYEYNASNVSQEIASPGISIYGDGGTGMTLWGANPGENITDGGCYNDLGGMVFDNYYDSPDSHYLRAIKIRKGVMFILDYMALPSRRVWMLCFPQYFVPGCLGCFPPGSWWWPGQCNHCHFDALIENQMTRLLAFETINPGGPYKARITVEPNVSVMAQCAEEHLLLWPNIVSICTCSGLCTNSNSYLTHGLDVDGDFNVYIALKGKNDAIVRYKLNQMSGDPTLLGGGWSFDVINGWVPDLSSVYTSRNLGSWTANNITNNVTLPDAVLGYPDLIESSMAAGVSCEGCSMEGAIEPSVCGREIKKTNESEYENINQSLANSNIVPGVPLIRINASNPPIYRRNSLATNITAFIRFNNYLIQIVKITGGCPGGGAAGAPVIILKDMNVTSYSNNLETIVEGGGTHFALTSPSYPERPARPPDTLPYLAYDYYSNRFFYKHFAMMDNNTNASGNINTMGPPPSMFWNGGVSGPNIPYNYPGPWCAMFPDACAVPDDKEWILNASYRKKFQTFQNQYYGYKFISTVPTVNMYNEITPIAGVQGQWDTVTNTWKYDPTKRDPNALGYINPDILGYPPGTIPLNSTIEWDYPVTFNFTPSTITRNPLSFTPNPGGPPPGDYTFEAKTNVSRVQLSIMCTDSAGTLNTYTVTLNNASWTPVGVCKQVDGISISGASGLAYVFIKPEMTPDNPYEGICFETVSGPNSMLCSGTRAWFRQAIPPNTVVAYANFTPEIPMATRYPLLGEPDGPWPASLKIVPVNMSGPTVFTLHGLNNTFNVTGNNEWGSISATANLIGTQLPNPLPIYLTNQDLYFRSSAGVKFSIMGFGGPGMNKIINYVISDGWVKIEDSCMGFNCYVFQILNVKCSDPFGCLFEFSNDSAGARIIGKAYLGQHLNFIAGTPNGLKYPEYTYSVSKGEVQSVPDNPYNRNFMNISAISGKGYIGDRFNVYTNPDVTLYIDKLTASYCSNCTSDADCAPGGVCNVANGVCMNGDDCGVAKHPSGAPCFQSYVCPRIDLTNVNESLEVISDKSHATTSTTVKIIGTDTTPGHHLQMDTATLSGSSSATFGGNTYSAVFFIEVTNAVKGETLTFTSGGYDVASLYIPTANSTTKSSIGSIFPKPRKLKIMSDAPPGSQLTYTIVGIKNDDTLIEETSSKNTQVDCSLKGPANVLLDLSLNNVCKFQIDPILSQAVGVPFPIRITTVPTGASVPTPPAAERLEYPPFSNAENNAGMCGGTAWDLATKNGVGACFITQPVPPVIPGYWTTQFSYLFTDVAQVEMKNLKSGGASDIINAPDGNTLDIRTCFNPFWPCFSVFVLNLSSPENISQLSITMKAPPLVQGICPLCGTWNSNIQIRMSDSATCSNGDADADFNAMTTYQGDYDPNHDGNFHDEIVDLGATYNNIKCIGIRGRNACIGAGCLTYNAFFIDAVGVNRTVWVPPVIPPPPPPDSFAVVKFFNPVDIDGFMVTARSLTPSVNKKLTIKMSDNPGCYTGDVVADANPANWPTSHDVSLIADGIWHDNVDSQLGLFRGAWCLAVESGSEIGSKWDIDSIGIYVPQPDALFPLTAAGSIGPACALPNLMLGSPDAQAACSPQALYGKFDKSYTLSEFLIYAQTDPITSPTVDIRTSNDPNCWDKATAGDFSTFGSYGTFHATSPSLDPYVVNNGLVSARCVQLVLIGGNTLSIDAVGIVPAVLLPDCSLFSGNANLTDSSGMCPTTIGPFTRGVWRGDVMVPNTNPADAITATNNGITGSSNSFSVTIMPGSSSASITTNNQFTHVLAIEIHGSEGENFTVTTAPLYADYSHSFGNDQTPEQIGVINVVPNDFVLGFHQNRSGTYIYSQHDTVKLNIPDNNSLGLHDFRFDYYDRFNNTFIIPYTIWLRQPTVILLNIITTRDPGNRYKTIVNVNAKLLYQRLEKPEEKPNTPMSAGYNITLYVQNSSTTFYGDNNVETDPPTDPRNCDPIVAGVCPNPAAGITSVEDSNCSCPDWWDDPNDPGECIPHPSCHQFGILANTTPNGYLFPTNDSGEVNASFAIFGFGRRLMFAVFNGTRDFAPSIDIKPFYAGGMSIGMGSFSVLEPVLLISATLGLLAIKRKFNKQKSR